MKLFFSLLDRGMFKTVPLIWVVVFLFGSCCTADEPVEPGVHKKVVCTDGKHTFDLFLPSAYKTKPKKQFPVLYISNAGGKPKFKSLEAWAEEKEFLMICINDSKNGDWAPVINAQDEVLKSTAYLRKHHCLQFATGNSGAAWASVKLAKRYPQMIAGVLLQIHSGNGEFCVSGQSVTFLYGSTDKLQRPETVEKAFDIYERERFHVAKKQFEGGHRNPSSEDIIQMLDFMFDFQRFNNAHLTSNDMDNYLESEFEFSNAIEDVTAREESLFGFLSSSGSVPAFAKSPYFKKAAKAWGEAYLEILEEHHDSPVEAYALLNYAERAPFTKLIKGSAKLKFKELMDPVLEHPDVVKEVDAQSSFNKIFRKEAKLNGRAKSIKSLVKRYKSMIENHPGTSAANAAELRVAELEK